MESPIPWSVVVACVIAMYMLLNACAAQPQSAQGPLTDVYHQSRSLVFDDPAQRVLESSEFSEASAGLPWYLARNDATRAVDAGLSSPKLVESVTWRYDSQRLIGDRIHDHVHESTWTRTYRRQVR